MVCAAGGACSPRWAPGTIASGAITSAATNDSRRIAPLLTLARLRAQVAIHGLDERVRRPRTCRRAVPAVVIQRRPRRLHLIERRSFIDQFLNPVADDRQHVAILEHVGFVAEPA